MKTGNSATQSSPPQVTVSVVSHGNASALQSLLYSLAQYESASSLQLIVTDNLGHDLPELHPSPWNSLTIIRNKNPRGFAGNHNAAFRYARAAYFCALNPDVVFLQPVFQQLIETLESGQGNIAAPLVIDSSGVVQDSFRQLPSPWELIQRRTRGAMLAPQEFASQAIVYPEWLAGIFLLMRTEIFARLDGFDESYRLYFEDVDFCTRARLAGLSLFVDTRIRIQHDARRASRQDALYLLWHSLSAIRFFTSDTYRQARKMRSLKVNSDA